MNFNLRKSIVKDSSLYISSNYFAQILGFIVSVASKKYMGPAMVGVWNIVKVIMDYSAYTTLGTSKAAFREIPHYLGKGDVKSAERVRNEVFTFTLIMTIISSIAIGTYAFFDRSDLGTYLFVGLLYISLIILIKRIYDYYTTLLRASKNFICISQVTVLTAVLNLIFVFALVKPFRLYGFFAASFLSTIIGFLFVYIKTKFSLKIQLSKKGLTKLLSIGIPLLLTGLSAQTIKSLDKILIASHLGVVALGTYSIALMVYQYIIGIPNMVAIVLYPRMQEKYGETGSAEQVRTYFVTPVLVVCLITGVLIGVAVLSMPWFINLVLPKFSAGLSAMNVLLWASFFQAIGQQASTYLVTLDKQWRMLPILLFGIVTTYVLCSYFLNLGYGIQGVALGMVISAFLYNSLLFIYAKKQLENWKGTVLFLISILFIFCYFILIAQVCRSIGDPLSLVSVLVRVLAYLALVTPVLLFVDRKTGLIGTMVSIIQSRKS